MAEILSAVSLISFIVSGTAFIAAVFCWFRFQIPQVVGDLSGRTAKKSIERMRADYEKSGSKSFHPVKVNGKCGKLAETELLSENMIIRSAGVKETCLFAEEECTEKLAEETVPLLNDKVIPAYQGGKQLTMLEEIIMIHTDEVIG